MGTCIKLLHQSLFKSEIRDDAQNVYVGITKASNTIRLLVS
jgi:hypothetical protein